MQLHPEDSTSNLRGTHHPHIRRTHHPQVLYSYSYFAKNSKGDLIIPSTAKRLVQKKGGTLMARSLLNLEFGWLKHQRIELENNNMNL